MIVRKFFLKKVQIHQKKKKMGGGNRPANEVSQQNFGGQKAYVQSK